jgi:hypothetical protein
LKDNVYNSNPWMEELKEIIHREIANVPAEQLRSINQNLFCLCEECLHVEGQHFQQLWCVNKGKNSLSFRMLSAIRNADSSEKFVCASQQAAHRLPRCAEPWNRSTK